MDKEGEVDDTELIGTVDVDDDDRADVGDDANDDDANDDDDGDGVGCCISCDVPLYWSK